MKHNSALAAALVSTLLATSCVSQRRYDEALDEARYYQRMYQDLEPYQGELEAEIALLKGRLEMFEAEGTPIDASYTQPIDQRLDELNRIAAGLGAAGDVTVLSVEGGYGYRLKDAVLFETGKADVSPTGEEVLKQLAADIAARPFQRLWVRGHTDSVPIVKPATKKLFPHGNLDLAASRALSVASILKASGIDAKKVVVAGFGPNEPVADNATPDGQRRNRRVEIFVIEDEKASGGK